MTGAIRAGTLKRMTLLTVRATRTWLLFSLVTLPACTGAPTAPSVARVAPFATLVGSYAVSLEIDPTCTAIPSAEATRRYRAVIRDEGWHFAPVTVSGGSYPEPAVAAEFWDDRFVVACRLCNQHVRDMRTFAFTWNGYIGGGNQCTSPEPLTPTSELHLCGTGAATLSGPIIFAAVEGPVSIVRPNARPSQCTGIHRITFVRDP